MRDSPWPGPQQIAHARTSPAPREPTAPWVRLRSMLARLVTTVAAAAVAVFLSQGPALGSCATSEPLASPYAFTGVVISTESMGRLAVVRTDAGATVEVRGTIVTAENAFTSVDRSYQVGGRYEFHPTNATSPFADNECTATQLLSMSAVPSSATRSGAASMDASDGGRREAYVGGGLAMFLAGTVASLAMRRRRSRPLAGS
jgi:hypothetical protein